MFNSPTPFFPFWGVGIFFSPAAALKVEVHDEKANRPTSSRTFSKLRFCGFVEPRVGLNNEVSAYFGLHFQPRAQCFTSYSNLYLYITENEAELKLVKPKCSIFPFQFLFGKPLSKSNLPFPCETYRSLNSTCVII